MKQLAIAAIRFYQRHISPHKGFACALRVHTGCASCSTLGLRAIRRHGVLGGLKLLRMRMHLCGVAHRRHGPAPVPRHVPIHQRGECDIGGCDGLASADCDLPGGKRWTSWCQLANCCDAGSCDWPRRDRKSRISAKPDKAEKADWRRNPKRQQPDADVHLPDRRR